MICPLSIGKIQGEHCVKEKCAWWWSHGEGQGECAIKTLTRAVVLIQVKEASDG